MKFKDLKKGPFCGCKKWACDMEEYTGDCFCLKCGTLLGNKDSDVLSSEAERRINK